MLSKGGEATDQGHADKTMLSVREDGAHSVGVVTTACGREWMACDGRWAELSKRVGGPAWKQNRMTRQANQRAAWERGRGGLDGE